MKASEIQIHLKCHPEDTPIEGNASAIDEATDREIAASIRRQLDGGNGWAWCCVEAWATYRGLRGASAYLGGCSYTSEEEFRSDGYWADLQDEAIDYLKKTWENLHR